MIPKAKNQKPFFERFEDGKMKKITPEKYQDKPQPEAPTKFDLEGFAKSEGIDFKALQEFVNTQKMPKETAQPKPAIESAKTSTETANPKIPFRNAPYDEVEKIEPTKEVGDIEENAYPQQLVDFFEMDEDRTWKEYDNNSFKYEGMDYDFTIMAKGKGYKLFVDDMQNGETIFEGEYSQNEVGTMQDLINRYESGQMTKESEEEPQPASSEQINQIDNTIASSQWAWENDSPTQYSLSLDEVPDYIYELEILDGGQLEFRTLLAMDGAEVSSEQFDATDDNVMNFIDQSIAEDVAEFDGETESQKETPENFTSEELEELFDDSDYNWQMMSVADNEAFYETNYQSDTTEYIVDVIIKDGEVRFDAYDLETDEELAVESSTPISTSKVMNGRELDMLTTLHP